MLWLGSFRSAAMAESAVPPVTPELACSVCLYVVPAPDADADELITLTVVNGQMVCMRHIPVAYREHHDTLMAAVVMESGGAVKGLSAYQDWRMKQERESGSENTDG
jgi:hypothetical protein